ncbi:MAG: hypothetical protein KJP07_07825, partial [Desulfatitalea sp.]|nr:hypothetical protein [Desulfatitalea sp.]
MSKRLTALVAFCSLFLAPGFAFCDDGQSAWTGNANLMIGQKFLEKDDWEPLENQFELGADTLISQA